MILSGVTFLPMKHKELRKRNWLFTANNLHAKIKFPVHVVDLTHTLFPVEEVAFLNKTYSNFGNLYSYTCITICGCPIKLLSISAL